MDAIFYNIIIVCVVLFVPFFFANWLTKGMLLKLMKVFSSRGQSLLVEVIHPIQNYYVIGEVKEGMLVVKDKSTKMGGNVKIKRINVSPGDVFRSFGVNCLRYDEDGNRIVRPDFSVATGFDPIKQESLLIRALYDPKTGKQEKYTLYILIGVVLILLIVGISAYNNGVMADQIMLMARQLNTTISAIPTV